MKQRQFEPNYKSNLGLKQSNAITSMPFGSLLDVRNMSLDGIGGKFTRRGYAPLFSIPGNPKIQSLLDFRKTSGVQQLLAYATTTIWKQNGVSAAVVRTPVADQKPWQWVVYRDEVYGVNGVDRSFKYDGTTDVAISITPLAQVSLSLQAGGTLAVGAWSYVATLFDTARSAESNPPALSGAPSQTTNLGNQTIRVTRPNGQPNEGYDAWRIYRRGPAETQYTFIQQVAYATTSFDDSGLPTGTIVLETDNGQVDTGNTPHPQSKLVLLYDDSDRLLMVDETNPTILIYSKPNAPHAWPSGNNHPVGRQDGFRITKIEKIGKAILIHKRSGVWILNGDPSTVNPERISGMGTQDFYTSQVAENFCVRLTPHGFYEMDPTQFNVTDLREDYVGRDIIDEERFLDWNHTSDIRTFNYRKGTSKHIYFFFPNSAVFATPVLVYDYNITPEKPTAEWLKFLVGTDIFSVAEMETQGEKKMIFGDGFGYVWVWDTGETDGSGLTVLELNGTSSGGNSANTLNDTTQNWPVNGLVGLRLTTLAGKGANQNARILSNTATQLVLTPNWAINNTPDTTTVYTIAAIDSYADEFWNSHNVQDRWKRMRWIVPYVRQTGDFPIDISFRRDFRAGFDNTKILQLAIKNSESLWGVFIWGVDTWGAATSNLSRLRFDGKYKYYSIRYRSQKANQRFFWDGHGAKFQVLYDRTG